MRPVKSRDNSVIQIGAWRVDPALDEISRDGQTTKLEPKMMQLLLCLAAHAGQVVSVEQLLDEVWTDVVVTPDSVYHAVAALRRVLGDDSKDPSYIANVMRRGYRLIAPVVPLDMAEASAPPVKPPHSAAENQTLKPTVAVPRSQSIRPLTGRRLAIATITALAVALAYVVIDKFWISRRSPVTEPVAPAAQETASRTNVAPATTAAFNPPPHSIAVLPFVNMSGDKEQEYFSDGLTEELLNSLSRINELQVAAHTSSFYFKGEHADLPTIAHKLNVASVLEGSVRRSGHTIRVTAQLNNAITGFHLWSQTYDRELSDVLQLETEIANAVASALKVTLLGDVTAKIEVGGTHDPGAFDAYLRGSKAYVSRHAAKDVQAAITAYTDAIRLDPSYALAFAARSLAFGEFSYHWVAESAAVYEAFHKAEADARKAIALAPDLAEGHLAFANVLASLLDFRQASEEYEHAVTLAPGNAQVLQDYSDFVTAMGRTDAGIAAARRALLLDPLSADSHHALSRALYRARRYAEAKAVLQGVLALDPDYSFPFTWLVDYALGNYQGARAWCEKRPHWASQMCLAMVYDKLGSHADAEAQLAKLKAGNPAADDWYQYAQIYAQWGDTAKALNYLDAALSTQDLGLEGLKVDPLLDPLRKEPRFQAIERALKFPSYHR
jgi:TolB-like protein/DNA-binding winged helix-turn-helix (wHTH) protein/Tfp pilus assembly protein PilF